MPNAAQPSTPRTRRREKLVEADVIRALQTFGFDVTKTSQHGKPQGMTLGIPDLYASHAARKLRLWIEVKAEGGRLSEWQRIWHQRERIAGGDRAAGAERGGPGGRAPAVGIPQPLTPERIRERRAWLGWAQGQLADAANVSIRTVAYAERGPVSASTLQKLARALGLAA